MTAAAQLQIRNLKISIRTDHGMARILDHVNLDLSQSEILGVAGESGCGKSTLIRAILGILPSETVIESGEILFKGENLLKLPAREMRSRVLGTGIGFIPQDPFLAFNPVFKVGRQIMEMFRGKDGQRGAGDARRHLVEMLRAVQLPDPEDALERYPHQFSGGQRQRILIAAALALRPDVILADEPSTALDVTTQLQILKLIRDLARQFGVSMLFVTHDFGVIAQLCDRVTLMYAGQTIETGPTRDLIERPLHPYARLLMQCHPDRSSDIRGIAGSVPSPLKPPTGCRFNPRCPDAMPACSARRPLDREPADPGHRVACMLYEAETADAV